MPNHALISDIGCRKGKRECIYPGASTSAASSSKPSRKGSKAGESNESASSASEDEEGDGKSALPAILDHEEDISEPQSAASSQSRKSSNAALAASRGSIASTAETGSSSRDASRPQANRAPSKHSVKPSISHSSRWPGLPRDVKAYLKYHKQSLSHHHYAFKYDAGDFLKTTFLEIAMNDDSQALLYAIVAFAAYHHAVASGDNKISPFLSYYNRSINMLKTSLETKRPNVTTLLTILQLATIEVSDLEALPPDRADNCTGIPRRLGQPPWPSKSSTPDSHGSIYPHDHHARRDASKDHRLVHQIRPLRWNDVGW